MWNGTDREGRRAAARNWAAKAALAVWRLRTARCVLATALAHRCRGPDTPPLGGSSYSHSAGRIAAARVVAEAAEEEEGVDPSSLPRRLAGAGAQSVVHAVLRGLVKERGNLTLGMQDYLKYVPNETDMTHGAVLAAVRGLEAQGLLERDPLTGEVVMTRAWPWMR